MVSFIEYVTMHKLYPIQRGVSKNGKEWKKRSVIFKKSDGNYSDYLKVNTWDEDAEDIAKYEPGDLVKVDIMVRSREYKDDYFTELNLRSIEPSTDDTRKAVKNRERAAQQAPQPVEAPRGENKEDDDLPF